MLGRWSVFAASDEAAELSQRLLDRVVMIRSRHGVGSGVIWAPSGLVVTNSHVVPQQEAEVRTRSGEEVRGTLLARDTRRDLAALSIPLRDLPSVEVGDSGSVRVGQLVLAAGAPFGVRDVITAGVVTAVGPVSALRSPLSFIQSDVSLVPGNSGGPLVDVGGKVIGLNSMVITPGLSLAVPSAEVTAFLQEAFRPRAFLGVRVVDAPVGGVMVVGVEPGSAAERAGIQRFDLLLAVNDRDVRSVGDLERALRTSSPSPLRVRLLRDGRAILLELEPDLRTAA